MEQLKTLAILYFNLLGLTDISEKIKPEKLTEIKARCFDSLNRIIQQNDGTVIKHCEYSVMTVFGLERELEDNIIKCARSAIAMRDSIIAISKELEKSIDLSLKFRISINTGLANVIQSNENIDIAGDVVNFAYKLEEYAPVNGILISYNTFKHIRGLFDVKTLEPINIKENAEQIQIYELLKERKAGIRIGTRGIAGLDTDMIGRDKELKSLISAFEKTVKDRKTTLVTVIGEAGVGKSRLEYEFGKYIEDLPYNVIYVKGINLPINPIPLYPFYLIICNIANIKDDEAKESAQKNWKIKYFLFLNLHFLMMK